MSLRLSPATPLGTTYSLSQATGLLTVITAATSTAGFIGGFRWIDTTRDCLVHRVWASWSTISGFTLQQEVGMDLCLATTLGAAFAGAGIVNSDFSASAGDHWSKQSPILDATARLSTSGTAVITNATCTMAAPFAQDSMVELGEAGTPSTVYKGKLIVGRDFIREGVAPIRLGGSQGIVLRNLILMGAGGTARVVFNLDIEIVSTTP